MLFRDDDVTEEEREEEEEEEEEKVEKTDVQEVGDNDLGALYAEMLQLFFLIFLLNDAEPFSFV